MTAEREKMVTAYLLHDKRRLAEMLADVNELLNRVNCDEAAHDSARKTLALQPREPHRW